MRTGKEHCVACGGWPKDRPIVRDDGSVAYMAREEGRVSVYVTGPAGANGRRICDDCGLLEDWSRDGRSILYIANRELWVFDLHTRDRRRLLPSVRYAVIEAALSPDGKWLALVIQRRGEDRLNGVVVRISGSIADESKWLPIAQDTYHLSLHWSGSADRVYHFSTRDQFRCMWAQRLDLAHGRLLGGPMPVYHFHRNQPYPWNGSWISVARDRLVVNLTNIDSSVWRAAYRNR